MISRELHFFKYCQHGRLYLEYYKDLKQLGLEFLIEHIDESYFIAMYQKYGKVFLAFLHDALELKLQEIIDMRGLRESRDACILKWVYMNSDWKRRNENN